MAKIFPAYKRSTVYALIGGLFHIVVVVLPFFITLGKVKLIGYLFVWFDFHLFFLGLLMPESFRFIFQWMDETLWLSLLGTLMYGLGGWIIGWTKDRNLKKV